MMPANPEAGYEGMLRTTIGEEKHHHPFTWSLIAPFLPAEPARILDAGCGNGYIASRMAQLGHEVTGVDLSGQTIEFIRGKYEGVRFEQRSLYDDLSDLRPAGGWDVVVSSEVIYCLYSPRKFLRNMHSNLRTGGSIIVITNYHGYLKNLAISLLGGWDKHFAVLDHDNGNINIRFFSRRTLAALLLEVGFREPQFKFGGAVPFLWRGMGCRAFA